MASISTLKPVHAICPQQRSTPYCPYNKSPNSQGFAAAPATQGQGNSRANFQQISRPTFPQQASYPSRAQQTNHAESYNRMNNPTSPYRAQPVQQTGQISPSSQHKPNVREAYPASRAAISSPRQPMHQGKTQVGPHHPQPLTHSIPSPRQPRGPPLPSPRNAMGSPPPMKDTHDRQMHQGPGGQVPASWNGDFTPQQQSKILSRVASLRSSVGVPAQKISLKWNQGLATAAAKAVDQCRARKTLMHNNNEEMGQNLYYKMMSPAKPPSPELDEEIWQAALQSWFDEYKNYVSHSHAGNRGVVGHFTQLVWNDSTDIGMAAAYTNEGGRMTTYLAANFSPQGNITTPEIFMNNVPSPATVHKCLGS